MKVVIMAGGQGTRFWPWSVKEKPKQFLSLMSEETMLQQTYNRYKKWLPAEKIFIITTEEYYSLVKDQLPFLKENQIILEPAPRDTAPCLARTALHFLRNNDNEVFAAVPADHFIPDTDDLPKIFNLAEEIAKKEYSIVTLGIKPTRPETGYGYIHAKKNDDIKKGVFKVKRFIEKPDIKKAEELVRKDNIYWNSGIFIWKPTTIEYYMNKHHSEIWDKLKSGAGDTKELYAQVPKISIDYAILEKADTIYTVPIKLEWDDVGNWSAWERLNKKPNQENFIQGNVHMLSAKNCIIKSDDKKVIVIGVENLIIASTEDGLLVCQKSMEQNIKSIINDTDTNAES